PRTNLRSLHDALPIYLRSDARGETNHVTESRLHTGLQAVHNRGTLGTQGKAHLPANARSGTPGPTDSLTGPRSDPAYKTAPRTRSEEHTSELQSRENL